MTDLGITVWDVVIAVILSTITSPAFLTFAAVCAIIAALTVWVVRAVNREDDE